MGGMIGRSPAFLKAMDELVRFAQADVPVLILGETGTGKELAARAVHYASARRSGPFVPLNCGALPDSLLESELFGHRRGAFTDAREARKGLVAHARGGTLLLDEVDSLSPRAQAALLRFVQEGRFRPVGADAEEPTDVRIVAAANVELSELAERGRFRRDLLFRLDVALVRLPPLRERTEDILPLAHHFLSLLAARHRMPEPRLTADNEARLIAYGWPGNIRELENVIHRALLLAEDGVIGDALRLGAPARSDVADQDAPSGLAGGLKAARMQQAREFERAYLTRLLALTGGNVSAASRIAGAERRHLGRLIRRHSIDPDFFRAVAPEDTTVSERRR
jgi:DNA-binding NtrC family response regulator